MKIRSAISHQWFGRFLQRRLAAISSCRVPYQSRKNMDESQRWTARQREPAPAKSQRYGERLSPTMESSSPHVCSWQRLKQLTVWSAPLAPAILSWLIKVLCILVFTNPISFGRPDSSAKPMVASQWRIPETPDYDICLMFELAANWSLFSLRVGNVDTMDMLESANRYTHRAPPTGYHSYVTIVRLDATVINDDNLPGFTSQSTRTNHFAAQVSEEKPQLLHCSFSNRKADGSHLGQAPHQLVRRI